MDDTKENEKSIQSPTPGLFNFVSFCFVFCTTKVKKKQKKKIKKTKKQECELLAVLNGKICKMRENMLILEREMTATQQKIEKCNRNTIANVCGINCNTHKIS